MHGPGPHRAMKHAGKPGAKNPGRTLRRIFSEILAHYKLHCLLMVI